MPVTRDRHWKVGEPSLFRFGLEDHKLVRFLERETFEEEVVDQTEDGGVHPDAERKGKHGEESERGRLEELADGEAEIDHSSEVRARRSEVGEKSLGAEGEKWVHAGSAARGKITGDEREGA